MILKKIVSNPFFAGSMIMVLGSNLYNFGQFMYHFLAGRFLGTVSYGDLAVVISILGLVGIIQGSLGMAVIKFIASQKDARGLKNFIKWIDYWAFWIGVIVSLTVFILSPLLVTFLNITQPQAIFLVSPILLFNILATSGRSILQGLLKFKQYILSLITESVVKISLTILLSVLGFATLGAIGGLLIGIILSFLVARISLSSYLNGKRDKKPDVVPLIRFSSAVFVQGLALTSMYSTDLILVKHFFPADEAGLFASLNVLGRIVFFGTSPVTQVMFPLVAKRHAGGDDHKNILYLSLLLVVGISAFIVLLFSLFPKIVIGTLYGADYLMGVPLLWQFAVFMALLSLAMLLTQYFLSIGKTSIVWAFAAAAISQIILIWFIHPSLETIIHISITIAALLAMVILLYLFYHQSDGKDTK